jgi:hypothetical protein
MYTHTKEDVIKEAEAMFKFKMDELLLGLENIIKHLSNDRTLSLDMHRLLEKQNFQESFLLIKNLIIKEKEMAFPKEDRDFFLDKLYSDNYKQLRMQLNENIEGIMDKISKHSSSNKYNDRRQEIESLRKIEKEIYSLVEWYHNRSQNI